MVCKMQEQEGEGGRRKRAYRKWEAENEEARGKTGGWVVDRLESV